MNLLLVSSALLSLATAASSAESEASLPPDTSPLVQEGILNAPPAEVWKVWSTPEGFKALGVAKADMDFRVEGLIRSHYHADGVLGDEGTIQNRIIAYEPLRMLAIRIDKPPKGFPFQEAWKQTWTVVTLTDLGDDRTHLRIAGLGWREDQESQAMRRFFRTGNEWTLKKLQAHFDAKAAGAVPVKAHAEQPLAPIDLTTVVPAACEEAWRAFTTKEGWKDFLGVDSNIELRPGGPFEIFVVPDRPSGKRGSETCTVLSYDPQRMLSFSWNAPPNLEHARERHTWVVVTFEALAGKTTRVNLRHLGFAERAGDSPEYADEFKQARAHFVLAWPKVLNALRDRAASGKVGARKSES